VGVASGGGGETGGVVGAVAVAADEGRVEVDGFEGREVGGVDALGEVVSCGVDEALDDDLVALADFAEAG
jgi:hypothetical protein